MLGAPSVTIVPQHERNTSISSSPNHRLSRHGPVHGGIPIGAQGCGGDRQRLSVAVTGRTDGPNRATCRRSLAEPLAIMGHEGGATRAWTAARLA